MLVTINTDASYCPETNLAAFAFWIASDVGKIKHSAPFKTKVKDSTEAEALCIMNALHVVLLTDRIPILHKIIINSDSATFFNYIHNRPQLRKKFEQLRNAIVVKYKLKKGWYEFRHVKAHKTKEGARNWVNNWCDTEARRTLKAHKLNKNGTRSI